jgi:TPR repeat protein
MGHDGTAMGQESTSADESVNDAATDVAGDLVVHDTAVKEKLLDAARALVLEGDGKFSISALCAKAGVERAAFRMHFTGKTALMAAVMQKETGAEPVVAPQTVAPQTVAPEPIATETIASEAIVAAVAAAAPASAQTAPSAQPMFQPVSPAFPVSSTPKAEPEPSVPTPDAWLERRLRVFERALNALEAKTDATARDHARAISHLEEQLAALTPGAAPVKVLAEPPKPETEKRIQVPAELMVEAKAEEEAQAPQAKPAPAPEHQLAPLAVTSVSKEEIAEIVQKSRDKARAALAATEEDDGADRFKRTRWLAIAALALVALFLCIGFTLGNTGGAAQAAWQGEATAHRHATQNALARTIALADYGDARAQARLALAYLRGQGVAHDTAAALRWSAAAAKAGQPVAEYLMGALYQQGATARPDPERAFAWFQDAALKGNLKAMHNLAIAYAEGLGTDKDSAKAAEWFTKAAERGYTDSAFDLAVLYERGDGVPQDLSQALKWYGVAAIAGDVPSRERVQMLREQMRPDDARLAANAAQAFIPLPALESANSL